MLVTAMRINKFIAQATGLSRRAADRVIEEARVSVNGHEAALGDSIKTDDRVTLDGKPVKLPAESLTIMLNKPAGYVCSRDGQGSPTVYGLLPSKYHHLKTVGRLDKNSSGLILLTDDGDLANQLSHPRYAKTKLYEVSLDKPLAPLHQQMIADYGVQLDDGPSRFALSKLNGQGLKWQVVMQEGRNRQIRRTFAALGYRVKVLHRTKFGSYELGKLPTGKYQMPCNLKPNHRHRLHIGRLNSRLND